jgi:hypothetical protein
MQQSTQLGPKRLIFQGEKASIVQKNWKKAPASSKCLSLGQKKASFIQMYKAHMLSRQKKLSSTPFSRQCSLTDTKKIFFLEERIAVFSWIRRQVVFKLKKTAFMEQAAQPCKNKKAFLHTLSRHNPTSTKNIIPLYSKGDQKKFEKNLCFLSSGSETKQGTWLSLPLILWSNNATNL